MPDDTPTHDAVPDSVAALIRREWDGFLALLDAAPAGAGDPWDRPTRLAGWTVEDLARHVHWGVTLESSGLRLVPSIAGATRTDELADEPAAEPAADPPADPAAGARAVGRELVGAREAIVPALRAAVRDLVAELERVADAYATGPAATVPMPYGDVPLDVAFRIFLMEAAVHHSDLLEATTGDVRLNPKALPACAAVLSAFWPVLAQSAATRPPTGTAIRLQGATLTVEAEWDGGTWADVTHDPAVTVTGPDESVLLFALGRLPLDRAGLTVTGDRALAAAFKELVPGP